MKLGWRRKTDEEIISFVREAYQRINCWKWALISFYSTLMMAIIFVVLTNVCYPDGLEVLFDRSKYQPSPTVIIWILGSSVGVVIGFFISLFGFLMLNAFMELRTWRLILTYHDCLQQAGLLPGEAGNSETVTQELKRE